MKVGVLPTARWGQVQVQSLWWKFGPLREGRITHSTGTLDQPDSLSPLSSLSFCFSERSLGITLTMGLWFPKVAGFPAACALQHPSHPNSLFPPYSQSEAGIGFALGGMTGLDLRLGVQ